jgi:hypothetical protein
MVLTADEEMAYRLVEIYVKEVSQRGEKRQMGLDTIINAYFYTLLRLKKKKREMGEIEPIVERKEEQIEEQVEKIAFPETVGGEEEKEFDFE